MRVAFPRPPLLGGEGRAVSAEASSARPLRRTADTGAHSRPILDSSRCGPRDAAISTGTVRPSFFTQPGREGEDIDDSGTPGRAATSVVLDLGVGNLGNVVRALRHVGGEAEVSSDPQRVAGARCLVLPGVGAFRPPRERLRGDLEDALRAAVAAGAWLLGICVGYQLLFEESEEFGRTDGLALLPGRVERLPAGVAVPHIGWNRLEGMTGDPLFAGLRSGDYVYFVHSYAPLVVPAEVRLAATTHGVEFAAAAGRGRVRGVQFHPERSGDVGLRVLRNFLEMAHGTAAGD